jgi:hypothetical protein
MPCDVKASQKKAALRSDQHPKVHPLVGLQRTPLTQRQSQREMRAVTITGTEYCLPHLDQVFWTLPVSSMLPVTQVMYNMPTSTWNLWAIVVTSLCTWQELTSFVAKPRCPHSRKLPDSMISRALCQCASKALQLLSPNAVNRTSPSVPHTEPWMEKPSVLRLSAMVISFHLLFNFLSARDTLHTGAVRPQNGPTAKL